MDGFISIERFESLSQPGKLLSLSFWRDEDAVRQWRNLDAHRRVQAPADSVAVPSFLPDRANENQRATVAVDHGGTFIVGAERRQFDSAHRLRCIDARLTSCSGLPADRTSIRTTRCAAREIPLESQGHPT